MNSKKSGYLKRATFSRLSLAETEPRNIVEKFAVVVKKDETTTVGHFPHEKSERFSSTIFFFFQVEATVFELEFQTLNL